MTSEINEQKVADFLDSLDEFVADMTDQIKAGRFYTCFGNVKLYVILEYGYPKTKEIDGKKALLVYTTEPTKLLNDSGLSTVALGIERLAQELKTLGAVAMLIDEGKRDVSIPAENVFQIQTLRRKAATFKLKTMPGQLSLTLENEIRRIVKQAPVVLSAWLLGILVPGKSDYEYMVTLEYAPSATGAEKTRLAQQIAVQVSPLLAEGTELLLGTTAELAGERAKHDFAPFYIKMNF